jgi:hypothetical protein
MEKPQYFSGHPEMVVIDYPPARRPDTFSKARARKIQLLFLPLFTLLT